jgi:hypothetical protein
MKKASTTKTAKAKAPAKTLKAKAVKPVKVAKAAEPKSTKQQQVIDMLKSENGATLEEIGKAMTWQKHSAQGFISGVCRKKLKLTVNSEKDEKRGRVFRIA